MVVLDLVVEAFLVTSDRHRCRDLLGALLGAALLAGLTMSAPELARAQIPRPGDERPVLPGFEPEAPPRDLEIPAAPAPAPEAPLASQPIVFVREFRIVGNTVLSETALTEATEPYVGRYIFARELQELRQKLTLLYVNAGYVDSGVVIPDQEVEAGVVELRVIEGRLADIRISGLARLAPEYVRKRAELGAGPPLNVNELRDRLQIINQNPLIAQVKGQLVPGDRLGESKTRAR